MFEVQLPAATWTAAKRTGHTPLFNARGRRFCTNECRSDSSLSNAGRS